MTIKAILRRLNTVPLAILPVVGWFIWFLIVPLSIAIVYSFSKKGTYGGVDFHFTWTNYARATDLIYLKIVWSSLKLALSTALCCLFLGYPMAYVMATARRSVQTVLLILVVIPFWTNFVVRAYATKMFFSEMGPVNYVLLSLGFIRTPIQFLNTDFAVAFGMVTNYLPFMILPLYVVLEKFDFTLLEAAKDLGASPSHLIRKILLPMTKNGMMTGFIFVFTPAIGEFVIPDLLGGARTLLIGNLITDQFLKTRDWPFGAALSMLLIIMVMGSLMIHLRSQWNPAEDTHAS